MEAESNGSFRTKQEENVLRKIYIEYLRDSLYRSSNECFLQLSKLAKIKKKSVRAGVAKELFYYLFYVSSLYVEETLSAWWKDRFHELCAEKQSIKFLTLFESGKNEIAIAMDNLKTYRMLRHGAKEDFPDPASFELTELSKADCSRDVVFLYMRVLSRLPGGNEITAPKEKDDNFKKLEWVMQRAMNIRIADTFVVRFFLPFSTMFLENIDYQDFTRDVADFR